MIQPNEKLLPGNVVMWRNRFYTLTKGDIYSMDYLRNFYSPIPLTPEIMVKWCGCIKHSTENEMYQNPVGLWIVKVEGKEEYFMRGFSPLHTIKYLHEFQNVSYCNSGEEMPVNIPNN